MLFLLRVSSDLPHLSLSSCNYLLNGPSPPPSGSLPQSPNVFPEHKGRIQDAFCPGQLAFIPHCLGNSLHAWQDSHHLLKLTSHNFLTLPNFSSLPATRYASAHFPSIKFFLLLRGSSHLLGQTSPEHPQAKQAALASQWKAWYPH